MTQIKNQELQEKIARKVKALREAKGKTQRDVYKETGIHIGRIEMAVLNVTVSTLEAICHYFDTDLAAFFGELEG